MSEKKYAMAVVLGRFQPFHNGHNHLVQEAKKLSDKVLVLVGSSNRPLSYKNPFSYIERFGVIKKVHPEDNVYVLPQPDFIYRDDKWLTSFEDNIIAGCRHFGVKGSVAIVGHEKEDEKWFSKMLADWELPFDYIDVGSGNTDVSATQIRNEFFNHNIWIRGELMPWQTVTFLHEWLLNNEEKYKLFTAARLHDAAYRQSWNKSPFPPVFVTVDNVVTRFVNGAVEVLLIKRGNHPGKGLWALPGGFLEIGDTLAQSALRELKEETNLELEESDIHFYRVFDQPGRSARGRTITHAFFYELTDLMDREAMEIIKAGDDAEEVKWVKYQAIDPSEMFSDHHGIITTMFDYEYGRDNY